MKVLVTGGAGFLGGAIVRRCVARGDSVRSFQRSDSADLKAIGVEVVRGDLGDAEAVRAAVRGVDVVFHVAAKAGVWGTAAEYERANVTGTRNVVEACRSEGVSRLVHTSTPSVVSASGHVEGVDESAPYATRFESHYPRTKVLAEKLVLAANGPSLRTVALRPHLIWGPGDTQFIPRLVARAKAGELRIVGSGKALVDVTYVDNAADAHLLAAERLVEGSPVCGKAYFLSNGAPVETAWMINALLGAAGLPPVTKHVPASLAWVAGAVLEGAYALLGKTDEPRMTRFLAKQLSTPHWFDISAARRELGYVPAVSTEEGLERLAKSLSGR